MLNNYTNADTYRSYHVILAKNDERGNLLLGDFNAAVDVEVLNTHEVKTIITAAMGFQHLQIDNLYTHIIFPLADVKTENIQSYFEESYQIIDENLKKGGVLVHCGAGISRSATIVIAYYMKKFNETFKKSITYVRNIRPNICPNLGFELQLKKYENQLNLSSSSPQLAKQSSEKSEKKTSKYHQNQRHSIHNHQSFQPKSVNIDIDFKIPETRRSQKKAPQKGKPFQPLPRSKTRQANGKNTKKLFQVLQTQLFVTGKSATKGNEKQQFHQTSNKTSMINSALYCQPKNKTSKNPLLGTWGPMPKRF